MEQLELFEEPIERVILEQNKVDLSTLREDPYRKNGKGYPYSDIIPEKYFIYKTGGLHFNKNFHKFGEVFPYIVNVYKNKKTIIKPSVNYTDPYPVFNAKTIHGNGSIIKIHRVTAFAFLKEHSDPSYYVVDHINGNIIDYRLENLRWVNHSVNRTGTKVNRKRSNDITNVLNKERGSE